MMIIVIKMRDWAFRKRERKKNNEKDRKRKKKKERTGRQNGKMKNMESRNTCS